MPHTIAIVGGGFSGTLTAVHLLRGEWPQGLHVVLVNPSGSLARGLAYGTRGATHLLNVPAARMSAFPDDDEHFLRFVRERDASVSGGDFVPRGVYGDYLEWVLREAVAQCPPRTRFTHRAARVVDVRPGVAGGVELALEEGGNSSELAADRVVLAPGNYAPASPPIPDAAFFADDPRYLRDPWKEGALDAVDPSRPVLLLGTGLTMLDLASELRARGQEAPMLAVSRRGLLPRPHHPHAHAPSAVDLGAAMTAGPPTPRSYLREVRRAVASHPDVDWRDVLASIRSITPALWAALPLAERARFIRHLQPYWDVHRHRVAPEISAAVDSMMRGGRLRVFAGRLLRARSEPDGVAVLLRRRGEQRVEEELVGAVINCTGPSGNIAALRQPLLETLLRQGLVTACPLGLGIRAAPGYALRDAEGVASEVLFHIGPLLKADYWESTAVPELRVHAARLAAHLCASANPEAASALV